jgi:hypothetical protein
VSWLFFGRTAVLDAAQGSERGLADAPDLQGVAKGPFGESDAYQVAEIYAWRGETDKAFEWLERAYRQRDGGLVAVLPWVSPVKWNPVFRSLHDDPRYSALLRKMNLPVE